MIGAFLRARETMHGSVVAYAEAWQKAVAAGVDMARYVSKSEAARLEAILRGKLIEPIQRKALLLPVDVLQSIEGMPQNLQEQLSGDGIDVLDGSKVRRATVADIKAAEIRTAFDFAEGRPRLLSLDEQRERAEPTKPTKDKIIKLRLKPHEYHELERAANKAGQSMIAYLMGQLYLEGILPGVRGRP